MHYLYALQPALQYFSCCGACGKTVSSRTRNNPWAIGKDTYLFDKSLKYSYIAQKRERHKFLKITFILLLMFLLYNTISAFVFSAWALDNESMQPGLHPGDRFIVFSSTLPVLFNKIFYNENTAPFSRGSIVLLDRRQNENSSWFLSVIDTFIRFFTAQNVSIFGRNEHISMKRLIAVPGDEISMVNFVLRVRPEDSSYPLTEFEFSERPYNLNIRQLPVLWDDTLPLSGNMDAMVLGPDECFVICDDRLNTSDSRTWGPVSVNEIIGRPVFRFWPPVRIGRP